ncbi:MAG: Ku protein [Solirubrobacteraceae bacterium]|nr:Ku protein [Solirubrobacteraceae bacterium]
MARSLWNGTVMLGLLAVPVKVHAATESRTVRFHEVHLKDGARIRHRRWCTQEDAEVPWAEVVKGYRLSSGEDVVLEPDELKAAAGDRAHVIEIEDCVDAAAIDPVFYDATYHLGAGDDGGAAYRLLHDALATAGRAAIGRFTFHDRERVVAIRPRDGALALHTLRFADEIVDPASLDVAAPRATPGRKELRLAERLVETLHEPFDPERHRDTYRRAVQRAIAAKAKGKAIEAPDAPEPEAPDDLAAALEASL